VPYEPFARLHSRRHKTAQESQIDWKRCLGFIPDHVVKKTLQATSQLVPTVESETREVMRDHFQTRLPELKVRRINDICYVDTFFSSVPSVRGYTCFNLYCFKTTGLDVLFLMHRRSQSPPTLARLITECGAPTQLKSDNAPEFKSKKWMSYLEDYTISSAYTEAHHPNQNLAERRGGMLKTATTHLLRITCAPLDFWCYAMEYVCLVRTVTARRSLNWQSPHERHWGDRPDISVFRFVFWEPIWFYNPRRAFPKSKMLKGRFLGIARNVGDAFCYLILTQPDDDSTSETPQVLARSVIRRRFVREEAPLVDSNDTCDSIIFYKSDGITPLEATNEDSEEVETLRDVVLPPDELATLRKESSMSHPIGHDSQDPFEDGIFEVYGPPSKRPRISNDPPSNTGTVISPLVDNQQSPTLLPAQSINPTVNDHRAISRLGTDESAANVVIATTTTNGVCTASEETVVTSTIDHHDDDRGDVHDTESLGARDLIPITQDDEDVALDPRQDYSSTASHG
jgi:hypothetical protein